MRMTHWFAVLVFCVVVIWVGPVWAGDKIGVVDIQKCIELTDEGKDAFRQLKAEVDKIQTDLDSREREIEEIRGKLEKGTGVLSESAQMQLQSELRRKSRSYRELAVDAEARIREMERAWSMPIFKRVVTLIKETGQSEGYDFILPLSAAVYFDPAKDVTNEVIRAYNQKHPVAGKPEQKQD